MKNKNNIEEIEVFLQGEGVTEFLLVKTNSNRTLAEIIATPSSGFPDGLRGGEDLFVTREDDSDELPLDKPIATVGIKHRQRLHVNRCRKVKVTVNFNHLANADTFSPSTTVGKVKRWAIKEFKVDEHDATEHALQLCGTAKKPNEDTHIGSLTRKGECSVCFDLVPKKRIEGAY